MQNPQSFKKHKLDPFQKVQEIIQSLSYNEHYIKIYPYSPKSPEMIKQGKAPHVLIYQDKNDLKLQHLIHKYAKEIDCLDEQQFMFLYLKGGSLLDKTETLTSIKNKLRVENLCDADFYFQIVHGIMNECSVQKMYNGEIQVPFTLKENNFPIYLPIVANDDFPTVIAKLSKEIQRYFGKIIKPEEITLSFEFEKQQKLNEKICFSNLSKNDNVQVTFKNGYKLPTPPRLNNSYLIIKAEEEMKIKPIKLHYDDIRNKKVKDVLNQLDQSHKWNDYGLKIGDFILKPEEKFSKANDLLKNTTAHFKNVAGVVIKESHIFQAQQENIRKQGGKVDIQKIADKDDKNIKHRQTCNQKIRMRAQKANNPYFQKNLESVQPILLYTSELSVKPSNNGPNAPLYRALNTFMRSQHFGNTTEQHYKQKWEYPFSNELLQQLKNIPPITDKELWRGIQYETNHTIGERILYKQFSSCSSSEQQAKSFAERGLIKFTKSFSGRPIKDYSYFEVEDQVLFEPYSQFIVTNITTIQNEQIAGISIPLYELQEIKRTPVPDNKALFLLWVDDKIDEGQKIWEQVEDIHKTTVMKQLLSTQQLKRWLTQNEDLLKDESAQFVMITNMARNEDGIRNEIAGVEAIRQYRSKMPIGHIFVYIGYLQGTLDKLQNNQIQLSEKLHVSNDDKVLFKFFRDVAGLQ